MNRDNLKQAIELIKENRRLIEIIMSAVFVLLAASVMRYFAYQNVYTTAYVASTSKDAVLYVIGKPDKNAETDAAEEETPSGLIVKENGNRMVRGTALRRYSEKREVDGETYVRVSEGPGSMDEIFEDPGYDVFIKEDNLAASKDDIVREKEIYVRTPVTIYKEESGPAIASFAPKGSKLNVTGYDLINEDGSINKYKVSFGKDHNQEGYVYGKYVVDTKEKADAVYNENGIYDKAAKDNYGFNLYGGKAKNLDYYPYEKPAIKDNEFCGKARAMYLNCAAVVKPKNYIKIINETDCNAVVADIKDGVLAYKSEVAKEWSPRSYKTAYASEEDYKKGIDALKESDVYLIGRIVVFNDPIYAKDHPEDCIKYGGSTNWPSAYSRDVWEYNVRLAREAIEKYGFNEIQFDYVRFPESSYEMSASGGAKFRNKYDEEKGQAVQNFCFYAADQIHEAGAYFSIDVFGESAYGYMTAYGQYWPGLSNIVDAISAMPYTDHMGGEGAWEHPYSTVKAWAKRAAKMQKRLEHPAAARTWITGYDTPHWAPSVSYGNKKLKDQVRALEEQGLDGGFIPWNGASNLGNYLKYKKVWNK